MVRQYLLAIAISLVWSVAASAEGAVSGFRADTPDSGAQWFEYDCPVPFPGRHTMTCGALEVPENWDDPASAKLVLPVRIFRAEDPDPGAPVVYLSGGPGQAIAFSTPDELEGWEYYLDNGLGWLGDRTLIVPAQRGTIVDGAGLACPEFGDPRVFLGAATQPDALTDWQENVVRANEACLAGLRTRGHDLSGYSTIQNARDIVSLRKAMNLERWTIFGVSYGTRLGLEIMRQDEEGIEAAILDSIFPPSIHGHWTDPAAVAGSLRRLFDDCRATPECARAYPDLETRFDTVRTSLASDPPVVSVTNTEGDKATLFFELDDITFVDMIFYNLYWPDDISYLPMAIDAIARDDMTLFLDLVGEPYVFDPGFEDWAHGMQTAVSCNDDFAQYDPEQIAISQEAFPRFSSWIGTLLDVSPCQGWPHLPREAGFGEPVRVDVPVLLMAGVYDPITPVSYAQAARENLPSSQLLVVPGASHSVLDSAPCAIDAARAFLADPGTSVERRCAGRLDRIPFALP